MGEVIGEWSFFSIPLVKTQLPELSTYGRAWGLSQVLCMDCRASSGHGRDSRSCCAWQLAQELARRSEDQEPHGAGPFTLLGTQRTSGPPCWPPG